MMNRKRTAVRRKNKETTELRKAKTELTKALIESWKAQAERETGLRSANDNRRHKADREHREYRDIVLKLYDENPQSRRWRPHRLAQSVRDKLKEQGRGAISIRTIERALAKK